MAARAAVRVRLLISLVLVSGWDTPGCTLPYTAVLRLAEWRFVRSSYVTNQSGVPGLLNEV